jgi:hypothetical protein
MTLLGSEMLRRQHITGRLAANISRPTAYRRLKIEIEDIAQKALHLGVSFNAACTLGSRLLGTA